MVESAGSLELRSIRGVMPRLVGAFFGAVWRFYRGDGFSRGAALAYSALLSLVPFFALAFGLLASFAVSRDYVPKLRDFIFEYLVPDPATAHQITGFLDNIVQELTQFGGDFSVNMVVFTVVTSLILINSIEGALNNVWQVHEQRPITQKIGIFSAIILIVPVIALAAFVFVELKLRPFLASFELAPMYYAVYQQFTGLVIPFVLILIAFSMLYWIVPKSSVRFGSALLSGITTAGLLYFAYLGFALYIENFASYSTIYGALAAIPCFLVWLYVFSIIVIFGAEVGYQWQYSPRSRSNPGSVSHDIGDAAFFLAIQTLVILAEGFQRGESLPDETGLAEKLGCSVGVLKQIVDRLEANAILSRSTSDDHSLVLLKSPASIEVNSIAKVLLGKSQKVYCARALSEVLKSGAEELSLAQLVDQEIA